MSIVIRNVCKHELDTVMTLNNNAGLAVLALDSEKLERFYNQAACFRVAEHDGTIVGFLIGFGNHQKHQSNNFYWFCERYTHFFYIDRIVIANDHRGSGLGRIFYADVESFTELRYPLLACEVFLDHGTDAALLFHISSGFREIGQYFNPDNALRARMLIKEMNSFAWIQKTYQGRLPDVAWIKKDERHSIAFQRQGEPKP